MNSPNTPLRSLPAASGRGRPGMSDAPTDAPGRRSIAEARA